MSKQNKYLTALKAAFPYTIPIFAGFTFLGLTYGIYMNVSGFPFWYPMLMSMTIFAGSMEFVAVNLLLGAFIPLQALAMTLMLNARHLFYGIAMLDKYRGTGLKKFYLIFGMCDESFSINCTVEVLYGYGAKNRGQAVRLTPKQYLYAARRGYRKSAANQWQTPMLSALPLRIPRSPG